jgi:hypothetical protein
MKSAISLFFIWLVTIASSFTHAQNPKRHFDTKDSLAGFDVTAADKYVKGQGGTPAEIPLIYARLQRDFIKQKFGLAKPAVSQSAFKSVAISTTCVNEDFEQSSAGVITSSSQVSGWVLTNGSHTLTGGNSCNLTGCCPNAPAESEIIDVSNGYIDPVLGVSHGPIYSVFGPYNSVTGRRGTKILRLNSNFNNYSIERASRTISVNQSNYLFNYACMIVMAPGHACCDAGAFMLRVVKEVNDSLLTGMTHTYSAPSTACPNYSCPAVYGPNEQLINVNNSPGIIHTHWATNKIDLSSMMGQAVRIEFISTDCTAGGHFGYSFIDAVCGNSLSPDPLVMVNGQSPSFSQTLIPFCTDSAVLSAPPGFNWIKWSQGAANPVNTLTNTIITYTPGTFTLVSADPYCSSPVRSSFQVVFSQDPQVNASDTLVCKYQQVHLTGSGHHQFHWSTGDTIANIIVQPSITTTYTFSSTDVYGCSGTASLTVTAYNCTGLEGDLSGTVRIFPNPVGTELHIIASFAQSVHVRDIMGRLTMETELNPGENIIQIPPGKSGIYFIETGAGTKSKLIVLPDK